MRRLFSAGFFSFLAVLLAIVALVVALTASDRAQEAVLAVSERGSGGSATSSPEPSEEPSPDETQTSDPEPFETEGGGDFTDPTATPGPLDPPSAPYTVSREAELLTVQNGECRGQWSVDFDEMRVKQESTDTEVAYDGCGDGASLNFTTPLLAQVATQDASPEDCRQAIRRAPSNSQVKPSKGLTLCLITDGVGDPAAAEQPRIARVTVTTVNQDLSLNLTVTTWDIPT